MHMGIHLAADVGVLLGARLTDPKDAQAVDVNLFESRIKGGVLLAPPGKGGTDLSQFFLGGGGILCTRGFV